MIKLAQNLGLIGLATLIAFAITLVGQTLWGAMAMVNVQLTPAIPWSAVVMPALLVVLVGVLSGRLGPRTGAEARRGLVPLSPVSGLAWFWSMAGGGAGVIAAAALWVVLASLVRVPPNVLPSLAGVPLWTQLAMLLVAIAAAPMTEEIAFRGYAMGLVRRRFGPIASLLIVSAMFAAAHLTQGLSAPKLLVYFLAGVLFGFVAWRTGSLLPAMVVHSLGDLTFFALVWRTDAGRRLVSEGGADAGFWTSVALVMVFAPLSILALRQLAKVTAGDAQPRARRPELDRLSRGLAV
ncbi:MAG TPA: CPBP family intramembrane glutamic endopeptidase [Caulobacteraceae bacterium]|nr:CPBP family intramembrane glutamic endopeptidase [Caulobacteraceae bacterium]